MTTSLTAFPADGYTARWNRWDAGGGDTVTLRWENEGWTANGEVVGANVNYVIRVSATWQLRQFLLFRDMDEPDLWLGNDGTGRWGEINGSHRPDLDGCHDVGLAVTPFTHSIPIRRLRLDVGDAADITTAQVDVETLGVVPVHERYHRVGARRYEYSNLDAGDAVAFDVDEFGLVHDLPARFRRV